MSRFHFFTFATIITCLFAVSCEKEDITLNHTASTSPTAAHQVSPSQFESSSTNSNYNNTAPAAAEVLDKLRRNDLFLKANIHISVSTEVPIGQNMRYMDTIPEPSSDEVPDAMQTPDMSFDCPYGDCYSSIPDITTEYERIAQEDCQDQLLSITCCNAGMPIYIVIYVEATC